MHISPTYNSYSITKGLKLDYRKISKLSQLHQKIRARNIAKQLLPLLKKEDKIIDIGCGTGWISHYLNENGFNVTIADVVDINQNGLPLILYKDKIPFNDKEFDSALLISVLHHAKNPIDVIKEARRVAKRVIVLEDTYSTKLEKLLLYFGEYMGNIQLNMLGNYYNLYEFYSVKQLKKMLNANEIKILWNALHTFRRGLYILDKNSA